jgi:hypothetical protein
MGLFSKKKPEVKKEKTYKELLLSLDIDIDSFNHEDLEPEEITIDDEVMGIIKKSGKIYEGSDVPFNIVELATTKEGKNELSLSIVNDEYGIKEIVDRFSEIFGPDDNFNSEFNGEDLNEIRKSGFNTIRKWVSDVNDENCITISYSPENSLSTIYIF